MISSSIIVIIVSSSWSEYEGCRVFIRSGNVDIHVVIEVAEDIV